MRMTYYLHNSETYFKSASTQAFIRHEDAQSLTKVIMSFFQ